MEEVNVVEGLVETCNTSETLINHNEVTRNLTPSLIEYGDLVQEFIEMIGCFSKIYFSSRNNRLVPLGQRYGYIGQFEPCAVIVHDSASPNFFSPFSANIFITSHTSHYFAEEELTVLRQNTSAEYHVLKKISTQYIIHLLIIF